VEGFGPADICLKNRTGNLLWKPVFVCLEFMDRSILMIDFLETFVTACKTPEWASLAELKMAG
jgi:hypothetical protein